jgi:hypothetical protein
MYRWYETSVPTDAASIALSMPTTPLMSVNCFAYFTKANPAIRTPPKNSTTPTTPVSLASQNVVLWFT